MSPIPEHVDPALVRTFDHHSDPAVLADPIHVLDEERRSRRYFYSDAFEGFWVFTHYADVHEVFQRAADFSNHPAGIPGAAGWPRRLIPLELDPPEHGRYRRLLAPSFSPARAETMEGAARTLALSLIEPLVTRGRCEFIAEFGCPYPTTIFTDLFGLPRRDAARFLEWNATLLHNSQRGDDLERRRQAGVEITRYLQGMIGARRRAPEDDVISALLAGEVDGRPIGDEEALDTAVLLFIAGLDTVTAALGWIFWYLARHPDQRRRLIEEPAVIPQAVEELLRYHSFLDVARTATVDTTVGGCPIRTGDRILLDSRSIGRDEDEFENASVVDFDRRTNRHLAFGSGPHRCLGSHLARMELRVAVEEWHRLIPDYAVAPDATVAFHGGGVAQLRALPLVF